MPKLSPLTFRTTRDGQHVKTHTRKPTATSQQFLTSPPPTLFKVGSVRGTTAQDATTAYDQIARPRHGVLLQGSPCKSKPCTANLTKRENVFTALKNRKNATVRAYVANETRSSWLRRTLNKGEHKERKTELNRSYTQLHYSAPLL